MTRLMEELERCPTAVFEIETTLPSGNKISGTIGPIINRALQTEVTFSDNPPTADDIRDATEALNFLVGWKATKFFQYDTEEGRKESIKECMKLMGGGQG